MPLSLFYVTVQFVIVAPFLRLVELLLVSILSGLLAALFLPGVYLIKTQYSIFSVLCYYFHFYNTIYGSNAFTLSRFKSKPAGGTDIPPCFALVSHKRMLSTGDSVHIVL